MAISLLTARKKRSASMHFFFPEATTGFEPVIKVLQTYALPLGYVAVCFSISEEKWRIGDSNPGPTGYEPVALTN